MNKIDTVFYLYTIIMTDKVTFKRRKLEQQG